MTHPETARRVLIVLPWAAHLMDVAGPAQVFTNAAELTDGGYEVHYVAAGPSTPSHQGLMLSAATTWPLLQSRDLVIVPGWKTERIVDGISAELRNQVVGHWESGGHIASVCAGALALASAGILDGHRATTHHDLIARLGRHRGVTVATDVLFTCEPRLHTSAGIANGIDLSLHLVAHDHGPALAARVARTLVVPAWRPGNASQVSVMLRHRDHLDDLTHRAQDLFDNPDQDTVNLDQVARCLGVSGRTLARRFVRSTGMTPRAYLSAVRRERATHLHEQGWTWEAAARAVGYADARSLRPR